MVENFSVMKQSHPKIFGAECKRAGQEILNRRRALAEALVAVESSNSPNQAGRGEALQDAGLHLACLAEALAAENPNVFANYIARAKVLLAQRGISAGALASQLENLAQVLNETLPEDLRKAAVNIVECGRRRIAGSPEETRDFAQPGDPHPTLAQGYLRLLLSGEREVARRMIHDALQRGIPVKEIYLRVFQPSLYEIGRLWQYKEISVAQEHYCSAATQWIMSQLYPYILTGEKNGGTFVCTSVAGDLHEIGARMVADYFEMEGWNSYYLGASTPADDVIAAVVERKAEILGVSVTMSYHVRAVEELVRRVRCHTACAAVKILVGGRAFDLEPDLWRRIGADGSASDADKAIALAEHLAIPPIVPC